VKGVTEYKGLSKFYFISLLKKIIKIGNLKERNIKILDFGCGYNMLKRILGSKVIGYDIVDSLSDIDHWKNSQFELLVANQVFYSFSRNELEKLLKELKQKKRNLELIVTFSNQNIINNIGKFIFNKPDAHEGTRISPHEEKSILLKHCDVISTSDHLYLATILRLQFKK
jgi:hypothetical protein